MNDKVSSLALEDWWQSDRPLKTLLLLYREDMGQLALSFLFYVIKHSPVWITPLITANVIDSISTPTADAGWELGLNATILVAMILQNLPMHYQHIRLMSRVTRKMEARLRLAIARQLQQLTIEFHHRNSMGALQNKLLQDVEAVEQLTSYIFQFVPSTLLTILIAVVTTAVRAPWFLWFYLVTVPVAVVLIKTLRTPIRERNSQFRQQIEELSASLIEMLQLIPITRSHGVETFEVERIEGKLTAVQRAGVHLDSINAVTNASSWVTFQLFDAACMLTAAWFAYRQQFGITVGDVVLLTGYFSALTSSVMQLTNVLPQLGKGFEAIRSIGDVLECPDLELNHGKIVVKQIQGEFSLESVSYIYPSHEFAALQGITLQVQPGETVAIVGPSGAGKSTLLNLLIGFLRPTSGRILLDGQDMSTLDLRTYRQFLSVVSQQTILFEGTVRENILYGQSQVKSSRLWQAIQDANAADFIQALPQGLNTRIGENGVKLSGGERQRIAIARALIRNPSVLILDEATASLDSLSERLIQEALEHLMRDRTTFVVAHRLSTIRKADRIVVLDRGQVQEVGNHDQLMQRAGIYATLRALQH